MARIKVKDLKENREFKIGERGFKLIKGTQYNGKARYIKVSEKKESGNPTAEDRIGIIWALGTVEAVENALKGETAKTVKQSGADRIFFLENIGAVSEAETVEELEALKEAEGAPREFISIIDERIDLLGNGDDEN